MVWLPSPKPEGVKVQWPVPSADAVPSVFAPSVVTTAFALAEPVSMSQSGSSLSLDDEPVSFSQQNRCRHGAVISMVVP